MRICMHCKEEEEKKLYNEWICITCRRKWEKDFYDRLKKKASEKKEM